MEYQCTTLADAYEKAMNHLIWNHFNSTTEDGEKTWQSEPLTFVISNPLSSDYIHPKSPYGPKFYEEYADILVNGYTTDKDAFEYDYHTRLFDYFSWNEEFDEHDDQIAYIITKLKDHQTSRRAIAITWDPHIDEYKKDVPCLQFIQFYIDGNDKLNMFCLFRSQDMLMGFTQNIYGLSKLMEKVSNTLHLSPGTYTHQTVIPHLYNIRDKNYLCKWL